MIWWLLVFYKDGVAVGWAAKVDGKPVEEYYSSHRKKVAFCYDCRTRTVVMVLIRKDRNGSAPPQIYPR